MTAPAHGSTVECNPTIEWTYPDSTDGIFFDIIHLDGSEIASMVSGLSWTPSEDEEFTNGTITFRVVARNCAGDTVQSGARSFTVNNTPLTPVLVDPPAGGVTNPTPELVWSVTGTQKENATYSVFVDDEEIAAGLIGTTYTVDPPLTEGNHAWHIEAVGCKDAVASSGADRILIVDASPPEPFVLTSPGNETWTNDPEVTFMWAAAVDSPAGIASYTLTVDGEVIPDVEATEYTHTMTHDFLGWLFLPTSAAENNWMDNNIGYSDHWIGATDKYSEGNWVAEKTKQPLVYTNWENGEPNNSSSSWYGEDCARIDASDGQWDDLECGDYNYRSLCVAERSMVEGCPWGYNWVSSRGFCTKWVTETKTWFSANADCDETFTMVADDGLFEWSVVAVDNVGWEQGSETFTFGIDRVDPDTAAGGLEDLASGDGLPTFTWTAGADELSGVGSYEILLDGEVAGSVDGETLTWQPDVPLEEGVYDWKVRTLDKAGNSKDSATMELNVDFTPPTSAALVDVTPKGSGNWVSSQLPVFHFTAVDNEGGSGIDYFELYIDGQLDLGGPVPFGAGGCAETCTSSFDPVFDGAHEWYVIAYDSVGLSVQSESGTFTVETLPPNPFALLSPANGVTVDTQYPLVCWEPTEDTGAGMWKYEVVIQEAGGAETSEMVPHDPEATSEICHRPDLPLANGAYVWTVDAIDLAGNTKAANDGLSWTMTIAQDVKPPLSSVTMPDADGGLSGCVAAAFEGEASDPGPTPTSPPGSGVVEVQVQLDGLDPLAWETAALGGDSSDAVRPWSWTWDDATTGAHILYVRAVDKEGNVQTTPSQRAFDVDCSGPADFELLDPANQAYSNGCQTFTWESTTDIPAGIGSYELRIQSAEGGDEIVLDVGLATTHALSGSDCLSEGTHTWYVKAYDTLQNTTDSLSSHTLYVDKQGPGTFGLLSQGPLNPEGWGCNDGSLTVTWSAASDAGPWGGAGMAEEPYQVYLDESPVGSPKEETNHTFTNLTDGPHTWSVRAFDALGNWTDATAIAPYGDFQIDCMGPAVTDSASLRLYAYHVPAMPGSHSGTPRNSGIAVTAGDMVRFDVSGELCFADDASCNPAWSGQGGCMGPNGQWTFPGWVYASKYYQDIAFGKAVAIVGGHQDEPMEVGTGTTMEAPFSGDLLLAVNDNDIYNCKSRWHDVSVQVGPGFNLLFPSDGVVSDEILPLFEWTPVTDAGVGVDRIELLLNGEVVEGNIAPDAVSFLLPLAFELVEQDNLWSLRAYDTLDNMTESAQWLIVTDLTPPEIFDVTLPAEGDVVKAKTPDLCWEATTDTRSEMAHYLVFLDDQYNTAQYPDETCQSPKQALDEGEHCFYVVAQDELRHERTSTHTRCFVVDSLPPDEFALLSPEADATSYTAMPEFCWETTTDAGTGVKYYELWLSGNLEANIPHPQVTPMPASLCWTPSAPLPNGPYGWFVKAVDDADWVTQTPENLIYIDRDITPPVVDIDQPTPGEMFGAAGVLVYGSAVDGPTGTGIATITVFNPEDMASSTEADVDPETGDWSLLWPVDASGAMTLCALGMDNEGNANTAPGGPFPYPCVEIVTDVSPPLPFNVLSPSDGAWVGARPTFTWQATTDSPAGVQHYYLQVDGQDDIDAGTETTYELGPDEALPDGDYSWTVTAADSLGNLTQASNSETLNVDGLPPMQVNLDTPPEGAWLNNPKPTLCWLPTEDTGLSGIAQHLIRVDGAEHLLGSTATCYTPADSLSEGTHSWDVAAIDVAENTGPVSPERTFILDLTPPPIPSPTYPADNMQISANPPVFHWLLVADLPATSPSGVCGYVVTVNGVEAQAEPDANTLTWPDEVDAGAISWTVKAFDCAGNHSNPSAVMTAYLDVIPPIEPVVLTPVEGAWLDTLTPGFSWQASSDDSGALCGYFVAIDGDETFVEPGTLTFTPIDDLSEGSHVLEVFAEDCAGNRSSASPHGFGLDVTSPEVPALSGPTDGTCTADDTPSLTWFAAEDTHSGVASISVSMDGDPVSDALGADATDYQSVQLAEGPHSWSIEVTDLAGNSVASSLGSFTVDTSAPSCELTALVEPQEGSAEIGVTGGATDSGCGVSSVEVRLNGGPWIQVEPDGEDGWASWAGTLDPGDEPVLTVECRAFDVVGNESELVEYTAAFDDCNSLTDCGDDNVCSSPLEDETPCDDGDACTQQDSCSLGDCMGADPVVCEALDQCHAPGECDPQTGICSDPPAEGGTACDDENSCTQVDMCDTGICNGTNPIACEAVDDCHIAGTCDPTTGTCSNPKADDGTICDDENPCSQVDTCSAGTCVGADPVICQPLDTCHVAGVCDPVNGECSNPIADDGTTCDDGDACTLQDSCSIGECVGEEPALCEALDQCHVPGGCDPATGTCSNPPAEDGTECDDGNDNTIKDACLDGLCLGEGCTCSSVTECCDGCSSVNEEGPCDADSDGCTMDDYCTGGLCIAGEQPDCSEQDSQCTVGICVSLSGSVHLCAAESEDMEGTPCDDEDPLSDLSFCMAGECVAEGCTCPTDGDCCDGCLPISEGEPCLDADPCSMEGVCADGVCQGEPKDCSDIVPCTVDYCDPGTGECVNTAEDLDCDDDNECTEDSCDTLSGCENLPVADWTDCNHTVVLPHGCFDGSCELMQPNDTCEGAIGIELSEPVVVDDLALFHPFLKVPESCGATINGVSDAFYELPSGLIGVVQLTATPTADVDIALVFRSSCSEDAGCEFVLDAAGPGEPEVLEESASEEVAGVLVQVVLIDGGDLPEPASATLLLDTIPDSAEETIVEAVEFEADTVGEDAAGEDIFAPEIIEIDQSGPDATLDHISTEVLDEQGDPETVGSDTSPGTKVGKGGGGCSSATGTPASPFVPIVGLVFGIFIVMCRRRRNTPPV